MLVGVNPRSATRQYRPDIDGLRCLAVLSVVAFHAGVPRLDGGFIGVDVFFAISGYLIGAHVYQETRAGNFRISKFYERRAKRILPALLFVLSFCYVAACLLLSARELRNFAGEALSALTSTANIYMYRKNADYFAASANMSPLRMTWSLGVEEQFYIGFPLIMMALKRFRVGKVLTVLGVLVAASLGLAIVSVFHNQNAAFYLIPARAWEIGAGCLLGIVEVEEGANSSLQRRFGTDSQVLAVIGLLALFGCTLFYNDFTRFPGLAAVPPVVGALILIRTRDSFVNRRILGAKPLAWVGLVSYSWYLWHWPLLSFAHIVAAGPLKVSVSCGMALLALGLSVFTYHFIEQPFRRFPLGGARILAAYGIASVVFCIPMALIYKSHGWPNRYPRANATEARALLEFPNRCLAPYGRTVPPCLVREQGQPTLALLGDSHASALAGALRSEANTHGWQFLEETKSSCPPLAGITRSMLRYPQHASECARYNQNAMQQIIADPTVRKVILAGFWSAPFPVNRGDGYVSLTQPSPITNEGSWQGLKDGMDMILRELHDHGKEVYVVLDVPFFTQNPLIVEIGKQIPARDSLRSLLGDSSGPDFFEDRATVISGDTERTAQIITASALAHGAHVVDAPAAFCLERQCRASANGDPFYIDSQHLDRLGAMQVLKQAVIF